MPPSTPSRWQHDPPAAIATDGTDPTPGDDVKLLLLHGPNLSQLGHRDPAQYGTVTLEDVEREVQRAAQEHGATMEHYASEHEGDLVGRIHAARTDGTSAVVVNAGALTHYGHALADALAILAVPVVEVHLSNVHAREDFRRTSVIASACTGSIAGFGLAGYPLAVAAALGAVRA